MTQIVMPEGKKKTKRTYSLLGSTFLVIQRGGSARAVFGYLTELRKHRLVRERELVGALGQSCREEGTVRKEGASEIYLGDFFSLPEFLLLASPVGVKS